MFFLLFHLFLNITGELLLFGDRVFYKVCVLVSQTCSETQLLPSAVLRLSCIPMLIGLCQPDPNFNSYLAFNWFQL